MAIAKPRGRVPEHEDKRRRRNKPESYGEAEVEPGEAADAPEELGFEADSLIQAMWDALAESVESKYYSDADWQRVRLELQYGNRLLTGELKMTPPAWTTFQSGLNELLISPADKRRAGIDMKPKTVDPDAQAAVAQIAKYRERLNSA